MSQRVPLHDGSWPSTPDHRVLVTSTKCADPIGSRILAAGRGGAWLAREVLSRVVVHVDLAGGRGPSGGGKRRPLSPLSVELAALGVDLILVTLEPAADA